MKVTGIEILPPVGIAHRNVRRSCLLFKLLTDEGICGLGEASLHVLDEALIDILQEWVDYYLVGKDPLQHELHWMRLYQDTGFMRHGPIGMSVLSGLDIALWDIKGKALGRPIYELLGGPVREEIRVYANGWYSTPADPQKNAAEAQEVVGRGYDALKFDPFGTRSFYTISLEEADLAIARVAAVREAVGPHVDMLIEGHAKFNVAAAIQLGLRLQSYRPMWFEEPVSAENISELVQVRRRVNIPIAAGEQLYDKFTFFELVRQEAADVLQPDICNCGGFTELKKIAAIAEAQHLLVAPHNTNGPVGTVASFHAAAALPNFSIQEYHCEFYQPWFFDLAPEQPRRTRASVPLPTGPGLGINIDEDVARAHPVTWRPNGWQRRNI
jgi:galactonate dehydratase